MVISRNQHYHNGGGAYEIERANQGHVPSRFEVNRSVAVEVRSFALSVVVGSVQIDIPCLLPEAVLEIAPVPSALFEVGRMHASGLRCFLPMG